MTLCALWTGDSYRTGVFDFYMVTTSNKGY